MGEAASTAKNIIPPAHAWQKSGLNNGKRANTINPATQPPRCPECSSLRSWKDGWRGKTQRWLCRDCGYRFSQRNIEVDISSKLFEGSHTSKKHRKASVLNGDFAGDQSLDKLPLMLGEDIASHNASIIEKNLNSLRFYSSRRRVCETEAEGSKNLATVQSREEKPLRDGTRELPGTLLDYAWLMKKRGLSEETIKHRIYRLNVLVRKGVDLKNPDSVETLLATEPWTQANKKFFIMAYASFTKTYNIPWVPIKVKYEKQQPFIPLESEIDQLIAACGKRTATFLQTLKDTGARCGEIKNLKWTDVDEAKKTVRINDPEKGSNSRTIQVSPKTLAMLNALPKRSIYIFSPVGSQQPPRIRSLQSIFARQRNKLSVRLQNPRLKQIHFHTLRHWKATMEYAKTRDILWVKHILGHKCLENTEVYTHLVDFAVDEYIVRRPKSTKEEDELIEAAFDYVRFDGREQCPIYRKRK